MRITRPNFKRISTKVALSYVFIAILQGGLSILTLNFVTTQAMQASLDDQRLKTRRLIEGYFIDAKNEMVVAADLLAGQAQLANLLARGEAATLGYELSFYLAPLKLDAILVVDSQGNKIVDVGNAAISAVLLKRNPVDLLDKGYSTTISGEGSRIQLWSLHEISSNGRRRGMLCMARSLDRSFIGRIEEISSTQMLLALRKTILVNGRLGDNVFIEYSRRVTANPDLGASGSIKSFVYRTTRLTDYPELELVYFIDTAQTTRLLSRYVQSTLFILAATILVAIGTAIVLYRYTFQKPFAAFQDAIRRISSGDLSFKFSQGPENEFADLEREFETMTENLSKLERELQIRSRMAAVGEMVAGVAHQIRNPLAIMKVSAEMIRDLSTPKPAAAKGAKPALPKAPSLRGAQLQEAKVRPLVEMIISEIDSLGAIVSKFLDFTKPLKVKPEEVSLPDFLARTASLIPMAQFPGRELVVETGPGAAKAVFDRRLMEQAVCNLLENALAASKGGGRVVLRAERSAAADSAEPADEAAACMDGTASAAQGQFRIAVSDEGEGMDDEVRSQLFHPFFTTKSDGTGLGLSIVHRIVEEHGGSVEVESSVGAGTRISIVLGKGRS